MEIQIGNFKAFGPPQSVPLRPLTLVCGPNSAGKSSIIQSLLLARHIHDTGTAEVHQTTLGGTSTDLGGFPNYVHRHQCDQDTTIRFTLKREDIDGKFHYLDDFREITLAYQIGLQAADTTQEAVIKSVTIFLDDSEVLRLVAITQGLFRLDRDAFASRSWLGDFVDTIQSDMEGNLTMARELEQSLTREKFWELASQVGLPVQGLIGPITGRPNLKGCLALLRGLYRHSLEEKMKQAVPEDMARRLRARGENDSREAIIDQMDKARFRLRGLALSNLDPLPRLNRDPDAVKKEEDTPDHNPIGFFTRLFRTGLDESADVDTREVWACALRYDVECLIEAANKALIAELSGIYYLGPLRWIPPRLIPDGEQFDASWTAGGGDAWRQLRRNPKLLARVNHFLQNVLRSRYQLECRLFSLVKVAAASVEDSLSAGGSEDPATTAARRAPRADETITTLSIVEADTGLTVSHRDVGTGISQLLPVLVNAAGAAMRLLLIEQPELHLHPALQAELGDVFIESALGEGKNTFLIETHSEHLILRIMRRIRESNAGRQPANLPAVKPDDVAILFVQPTESGSVVKHLRMDERGRLIDDWPGGFFEESFDEIF